MIKIDLRSKKVDEEFDHGILNENDNDDNDNDNDNVEVS